MNLTKTNRGFGAVSHDVYPPDGTESRIIQESSAIDPGWEGNSTPGSSFLWVGDCFHLNRSEVAELVSAMSAWLQNGKLNV